MTHRRNLGEPGSWAMTAMEGTAESNPYSARLIPSRSRTKVPHGAPPIIATDPAGGANKVLKVFKYASPASEPPAAPHRPSSERQPDSEIRSVDAFISKELIA